MSNITDCQLKVPLVKLEEANQKIAKLEEQNAMDLERLSEAVKLGSKQAKEYDTFVARMRDGIEAVRMLIDESRGVSGLHLSGEIALWETLETGGQFEEWLKKFNDAEQALKEES